MDFLSNKKIDRRIASWKKKIAPHIPEGMVVEGVVSGGKGISHRAFFLMLGAVVGLSLLLGICLKLAGLPAVVVILGMVAFPNAIMIFVAELGIYRSIFIFWDQRQVVIIEGGAYDRLIRREIYPLPLTEGISWSAPGTVVIDGWEIHLDDPRLCRDMLTRTLGEMGDARSGAWAPANHHVSVTTAKRSRARIAYGLCIGIGFIGWIGAFLCSLEDVGKWPRLAHVPLPVGPAEVVGDDVGNFFLISKFYRRIQKYGPDGRFRHGWHLTTPKGRHRYALDDGNRLHVLVETHGHLHYYLDETRGIVRFIPGESGFAPKSTLDHPRPSYNYHWWYIFPSVVRLDPSGGQTVVMRISFWLWLFTAPVPAFLLVVIGILGGRYIERRDTGR